MKKAFTHVCRSCSSTAQISCLLVLLLNSILTNKIDAQSCTPISTLPCGQLQVNLPYHLTFNSAVDGTLRDKNGVGTGFTMVDTYTGTRLSQDGAPSNPAVPGYEPSQLTITGGLLQIVTNKGIASTTSNNQINTLGVKVNSQNKLQIETTIINPYNGSSFEQAGIWFGLNDKTFLKLVAISGNRVELRRELNNVTSGISGTTNPDQRITGVSGLNTKTVRLRLTIDPVMSTAEGFYSIDGGATFQNVGIAYSMPVLNIGDMGLTLNTAFAGIFTTYRNGPSPVTYSFDDFSIKSLSLPPTVSLTSPLAGALFTAPASITINASAQDEDGTITKVEFFSNSTLIGTVTTFPYSFTWSNMAAGEYSLTAKATDSQGLTTTSSSTTINVQNPPVCSATGSILREYWSNITGTSVTYIPLTTTPTSTSQLTSFEAPSNAADNYGQRIRGYICAPATGQYTFYIASDDHSELWLSTSDDPAKKTKIAFTKSWTGEREWTKYASQKSVSITLQAGTKYYIEVLQKEGTGGDNLAVGWITPGSSSVVIIPGSVLSPVIANQGPTVNLISPTTNSSFIAPATITLSATAQDSDGTVAKVEFYNGTTLIGTATSTPFTTTWNGVQAGSYNLTAKATDNNGLTSVTKAITVIVSPPAGIIMVSPKKIYDNDVMGGIAGTDRVITIKNTSINGVLSVTGISLTGTNAAEFLIGNIPVLPKSLAPQESFTFIVAFHPSTIGLKTAALNISSNDTEQSTASIPLRGLGTAGMGGTNEPSLQAIFNLWEIPVVAGDDDAGTNVIHSNPIQQKAALLGDEISLQQFKKAGEGLVTIEPIAVFGPTANNPITGLGWYRSGDSTSKTELFTISNAPVSNGQTVNVNLNGVLSFDPGMASFGFYSRWPFFGNRHLYSEDGLNLFSGSLPHHVRVYAYRDQGGNIIPFTYIVAFEENTSALDYQDLVFVVRNVKPLVVTSSPVFSSSTYQYTFSDDAGVGLVVGSVTASDADGDVLTYSFVSGNTNGAFSIDAQSGEVRVAKRLNYHTQRTYTLVVKATDPSANAAQATLTLTLSPAASTLPNSTLLSWGTVANQPFNVYEAQGKAVGGKLYTFGGFDSQKPCCTPTSRAYVYDPAANTWTALAAMPPQNGTPHGGVTHAGFATDGTDIYFAGGYTANNSGTGQIFGTREVWKYIVAENRYERLPNLPTTISAGQLEYLNGRLHHIAGTNSSRTTDLALHYVLDLDNTAAGWKTLAPLPNPRQHAGSAVYEGKIYFIGGQKGHDGSLVTQKEVHVYDPATNTWSQVADLPVPDGAMGRGHISSAVSVFGEQIVVMGGETMHGTATNMVSAYSPATGTWTHLSPLPVNRFSGVAARLGNHLYYTSGSNSRTTYRGLPGVSQVLSYSLINAETGEVIQPLTNNTVLNIATLPTRKLNIRANTNLTTPGSVTFALSGAETRTFTDGTLPFALQGDNSGTYTPWTPTPGTYTLKATPYVSANGTGTAGTALTLSFKVVDDPQKITSFTLINADTEEPIDTFSTDRTLNLALLPTRNLNIRTNSDTATLGSVVFRLSGTESRSFTDNVAPFALFEDNRGDYYDWTPRVGSYTLEATPFTGTAGSGIMGVPLLVNLTVIDQPERQVSSFTLINAETGQPLQTLTSGSVLNLATLPTRKLNLRANTLPEAVGSVTFSLSGEETRTFTDDVQPYALMGDNTGTYNAWTPTVGHYTLKATPYSAAGGSGVAGPAYGLVFSVIDATQPAVVRVSPLADAFVRDGSSAGVNYGFDTLMYLRGTATLGNTRNLYLKFPLWGVGDVVSAKLRLYGRNTENTTTTINTSVFGVEDDTWSESALTWNNAPAAQPTALGTVGVTTQRQYYEVDVTEYVKAQLAKDGLASLLVSNPSLQNRTLAFNTKENTFFAPELVLTTTAAAPQSKAQLFVENLARFPNNEDFVASRIQIPWSRDRITYNTDHDTLRVRLHNKGMSPLVVSDLSLSSKVNWKIVTLKGARYNPSVDLPLTIAPGTFADVQVKFIPPDSVIRVRLIVDELTITSNDDKQPLKTLYLRGLFQREGEGSKEPRAQEMINAFGFRTRTGFGGSDPDRGANSRPKGDEVLSSYFVRVDPSRPVTARQMGAYHGCCGIQSETLQWFPKGSPTTLTTAVFHTSVDAQVLLPRRSTNTTTYLPSEGSFNPSAPFGFKVGGKDWTDTLLTPNRLIGVRVWKAIDKRGQVIANAYIIANDYLGTDVTNYDYNDNMYYVTNIRPELGPASASLLAAQPRAVEFTEEQFVGSSSAPFTLKLKSLGEVYGGGVQDPDITITAVAIAGENKGEFSATMPQKTTLAAGDSTTLSVQFTPQSEGLKTADLLIYYNNALSPLRVPLHGIAKAQGTLVSVVYRIKSGSAVAVTAGGRTYESDKPYAFDNLEPYRNTRLTRIGGTEQDSLYLSEQSSNSDLRPFRYEIPVQNGTYWVRLHFAEIYWNNPGGTLTGGAGSRVMSLTAEGELRLVNLDVAAEVGAAQALVRNFPVTVQDGKLSLLFSASTNRPMIGAVEIFQLTAGGAAVTTSVGSQLTMKEQSVVSDREKPKVYPNPLHQRFTISFPATYTGIVNLQLMDIAGRVYALGKQQLSVTTTKTNVEVDVQKLQLSSGIYFLRIHSENKKTEILKLIIQ